MSFSLDAVEAPDRTRGLVRRSGNLVEDEGDFAEDAAVRLALVQLVQFAEQIGQRGDALLLLARLVQMTARDAALFEAGKPRDFATMWP
jgi:hypothetical protein